MFIVFQTFTNIEILTDSSIGFVVTAI